MLNKIIPTKTMSTITPIQDICIELGWDGLKDEEGRLALSEFKALAVKHFDFSFRRTQKELHKFLHEDDIYRILTIDSREPEEIKRFVDELGFKTVYIHNENVVHTPNNTSDRNVHLYNYDYIVDNSGTLEDLQYEVEKFIEHFKII